VSKSKRAHDPVSDNDSAPGDPVISLFVIAHLCSESGEHAFTVLTS